MMSDVDKSKGQITKLEKQNLGLTKQLIILQRQLHKHQVAIKTLEYEVQQLRSLYGK